MASASGCGGGGGDFPDFLVVDAFEGLVLFDGADFAADLVGDVADEEALPGGEVVCDFYYDRWRGCDGNASVRRDCWREDL